MTLDTLSPTDINAIERALSHAENVRADTLTVATRHLRGLVDAATAATAPTDADLADKVDQLQDDLNMEKAGAAVLEQQNEDLLQQRGRLAELVRLAAK
jgi:hypothetical protein